MATIRKKIITRWVKDGKRVKPRTPGARKVQTRSAKYYGFGVPGAGRPIPLATNYQVAETMLARRIAAGEADLAGIAPPARARPLPELIGEWKEYLGDRTRNDKHVDLYVKRVASVVAARKWKWPREVTAEGVQAELARRMKGEGGIAPQTRNHYLTALRAFVRWLAGRGRRLLPADLLDGLPMLSVAVDLRRARRALTAEELGRLLADTAACGVTLRNLSPAARHLLYSLAAATGFRAATLGALTAAHLDLDAGVALRPARASKNRKSRRQPLPSEVVDLLRAYTAGMDPEAPLFPGRWWVKGKAAAMLRLDLARVGIPYRVETPDGPLYADFHSLRHTYVSLLEAAGVSLRDAMQLADHSDPRLTMARYGRSQEEALSREVQRLPVVGGGTSQEEAERVLLGWIAAGWAWVCGCPYGCLPNQSEVSRQPVDNQAVRTSVPPGKQGVQSSAPHRDAAGN